MDDELYLGDMVTQSARQREHGSKWWCSKRAEAVRHKRIVYAHLHVAVDDHSGLARLEVLDDDRASSR